VLPRHLPSREPYIPPAVREVSIPKPSGEGSRRLGVPTVSDRIAQAAIASILEPLVEPYFHPDSYGYRPGRSALQAVATVRKRCWKLDWLLDVDIQSLFDTLDHELVLRRRSRSVVRLGRVPA